MTKRLGFFMLLCVCALPGCQIARVREPVISMEQSRPNPVRQWSITMPESRPIKPAHSASHARTPSEIREADPRMGVYDAAVIAAVENRWYELLDARNYEGPQTGRVVLKFTLHGDGSISDITCEQNTLGEALGMLCQSAIRDTAPFAPWPETMRQQVGKDERTVTFTFYYD